LALAQKELAQPMPRSHLILLGCLPSAHQIPQSLGTLVGNPYRREVSRSMATRQLFRVAPIRLYPITCLSWYQRGRHHGALYAQLRQLPAFLCLSVFL